MTTDPTEAPDTAATELEEVDTRPTVPTSHDDRGRPADWQKVDPEAADHWDDRLWF